MQFAAVYDVAVFYVAAVIWLAVQCGRLYVTSIGAVALGGDYKPVGIGISTVECDFNAVEHWGCKLVTGGAVMPMAQDSAAARVCRRFIIWRRCYFTKMAVKRLRDMSHVMAVLMANVVAAMAMMRSQ